MKSIEQLSSQNQKLILASASGNLLLLQEAIEQGANIDVQNYAPMIWASCYGQFNTLKYLIELGSNLHANNNYLMVWTASNGDFNDNMQILHYILKLKDIDIFVNDNEPIKKASKYGHLDIVIKLLEHGASVDIAFKYGNPSIKRFIENTYYLYKNLNTSLIISEKQKDLVKI